MPEIESLSRRAVLCLAVGAAAGAFSAPAFAAPAQHMRKIPKTGEAIPAIGLGSWQTFDVGSAASERTAQREVLKLFAEHGGRVVTTIEGPAPWYPAEDYHQDYFANNTYQPYCQFVVAPKVRKAIEKFGEKIK